MVIRGRNASQRDEIRRDMRVILASLDPRWVEVASREVCGRLLTVARQRQITTILGWVRFFPGEIDLVSLVSGLSPTARFFLPQLLDQYGMQFLEARPEWLQQTPATGALPPEPSSGAVFDPLISAAETMVLVPGLAFDRSGSRLGRGKGYYDRFLATPGMERALVVGVGWQLQLVPNIPREAHDVPMQIICTEEEEIVCR